MPRVTNGPAHHHRRNKVLKLAKGFRGRRKNTLRTAKVAVMHSLYNSYRDRRKKKRDMRRLWIVRVGASVRAAGLSYSRFISGLNKANIIMNRKVLAGIAQRDPDGFNRIVEIVKQAG